MVSEGARNRRCCCSSNPQIEQSLVQFLSNSASKFLDLYSLNISLSVDLLIETSNSCLHLFSSTINLILMYSDFLKAKSSCRVFQMRCKIVECHSSTRGLRFFGQWEG